MNTKAEQHVDRAKDYVARGEAFYRKAAAEIRAARDEDATWTEIASRLERSPTWVKDIVAWHETPANRGRYTGELPFSEGKGEVAKRHARSVLRDAEPEVVADLLGDPAIRQNVAAGQRVHELRQEAETGIPRTNAPQGPTFIGLVLRINGWLDELVGMVERGEADVPPEFSAQSLTDIGVKAMRLKELVEEARAGEEVLSHD